jgi:transcriptional regulator with XRE-family HTH domain
MIPRHEFPEYELAARIRAARAYANLTRAQLAEKLERRDLTERMLARFEGLHDGGPNADQLVAIAKACGLPLRWFTVDFGKLEDPLGSVTASLEDFGERVSRLEAQLNAALPMLGASSSRVKPGKPNVITTR